MGEGEGEGGREGGRDGGGIHPYNPTALFQYSVCHINASSAWANIPLQEYRTRQSLHSSQENVCLNQRQALPIINA